MLFIIMMAMWNDMGVKDTPIVRLWHIYYRSKGFAYFHSDELH